MYISLYFLLFACLPAVIKLSYCQFSDDDSNGDPNQLMESFCVTSGYCYTLWRFTPELSKWQALQHCRTQNQTLATITNPADEKTLAGQLSDMAWVGLNLLAKDDWNWLGRDRWYGNPIPDSSIEDNERLPCLLINREKLFSASCNHILSHICEFTEEPTTNMDCKDSPKKLGNRWLCISNNQSNWMIAAQSCARDNGNLLIIKNLEELSKTKELLAKGYSGHYWTAGTRVTMTWDEPNVDVNPYSLIWANLSSNPNLDEVARDDSVFYCVYLSNENRGLTYKRCQDELTQAICSTTKTKASEEITSIQAAISTTTANSIENGTQANITTINPSSSLYNHSTATTTASSDVDIAQTLNYTAHEPQATYIVTIVGNTGLECQKAGVSERKYNTVMIFAYVLAALLAIAIALLVAIFIWRRRQRKKKSRMFDAVYSRKTYKTLGNGTLGRQRMTDPTEEWDKVMTENDDSLVEMRKKPESHASFDMDIVHNVPLDPRGSVEQPLTIPRESHMVTLQRGKSVESQNSLASSDVATFTIDRASSTTSILKVPPPVPPKTPCTAAEQGLGLPPPPPPGLLVDYTQTTPAPPKYPPPSIEQSDPSETPPLPPTKPAKRTPRKQKKKQHEPDPIYSEIDKSRTMKLPPPPTSPKPRLTHHTNGLHTLPPPPPLNIDTAAVAPDNYSDSGVDMGVNSPPHNFKNGRHMTAPVGHTSEKMAMLDDIMHHMTSS